MSGPNAYNSLITAIQNVFMEFDIHNTSRGTQLFVRNLSRKSRWKQSTLVLVFNFQNCNFFTTETLRTLSFCFRVVNKTPVLVTRNNYFKILFMFFFIILMGSFARETRRCSAVSARKVLCSLKSFLIIYLTTVFKIPVSPSIDLQPVIRYSI